MIVVAMSIAAINAVARDRRAVSSERILLISSYNPETVSAMNTINDFVGYYDEHGSGGTVMVENMNTKSLSEAMLWKNRMRSILDKYDTNDLRPSLILLLGQEAWAAYLSQDPMFVERKGKTPVMVCMASRNIVRMPADTCDIETWMPTSLDYTYLKSKYNIVGGVLYEYDVDKNLDLIQSAYPGTKNVALLTDNSYGGLTLLAFVNDQMLKHKEYNFISLDGRQKTIYSMSEAISKLPSSTALMLGTWRVDKTESYFVKNSVHTLMDANKDIPVTTLTHIGLGVWAVGGYTPSYRSQGKEVAEKVVEYLKASANGQKPDLMTVIESGYVFSKDKLEELKSKNEEFEVPSGAEIINTKPSFYDENSLVIHVVSMVFLVLVCLLLIVLWFLAKTKKLTAALQASQKELIQAKEDAEDRNKMKTAFLANMSHEIRTPLNALVGFSEVLTTDETLSQDDRRQINDIISTNSELLLGLINDILDMARLESGRTKYDVTPCDVVAICRDTLSTCQIAARREDISYRLDTDMEKCMAMIDSQHIRQVLINLLSNSNKFTKSGSITLSIHNDGHDLRFAVTDTGIGIPKEKKEKVFERFEKLSETSQGFGIGLSLCKNIVEHFGGKIWVDSEYSAGAKFVFNIPFIPLANDK